MTAASPNQPLLKLRGVQKSFGALQVTKNISLDVAQGEAVGIIGPNGAGKSTLFNLIGGDLKPTSGDMDFDGQHIRHLSPAHRARLGIGRTYQIPQPFNGMSVFENVLVGATFAGDKHTNDPFEKSDAVVRATGLGHLSDHLAGSLRLLDRKRLELARALATSPTLLLLDEIAGGLTDAECGELIAILKEIKASGVTIVWIEHVLHALTDVVERIIVMDQGALIADKNPERALSDPKVKEVYFGKKSNPGNEVHVL